ncbi:MAG: DNA cytosine methyltransferase [Proteobacteria bacterium]|nr:DNA cytosine methyltransferase [Pseudomonadota bacterium]MDA0851882.1 DNA cytosine methyltransferase [Pseudomonadota bacterium]MDA1294913.1 DNA cytosine methyltransferase [Pseudomonadota bacterium]
MALAVFDIFSGCGGLSLGLKQGGLNVQWANENDPNAAATHKNFHTDTSLFEEDALQLLTRIRSRELDTPRRGDVDLLAGGPPCQGFSGYNRYRNPNDPRNSLMEVFLEFVEELNPRYVLIENVPGMLSLNNGQTAKLVLSTLEDLGFNTRLGVLQAGYYGLPQNRWRVFIWAAQTGERLPLLPTPTHSFVKNTVFGATHFRECVVRPAAEIGDLFSNLQPMITVGDAISDLPRLDNGEGVDIQDYEIEPQSQYQSELRRNAAVLTDHVCFGLGALQLARCKAIPQKPGSGWLDLPDELKPRNLVRHGDNRYPNRFGRLHFKGTFNTIVHKPEPYWSAVFHPSQDRLISVREAARAQGFPDVVRFSGSPRARYRQVGNAVPPPLAKALATELVRTVNEK